MAWSLGAPLVITVRTLWFLSGEPLRVVTITLENPATSDQPGEKSYCHNKKYEDERAEEPADNSINRHRSTRWLEKRQGLMCNFGKLPQHVNDQSYDSRQH